MPDFYGSVADADSYHQTRGNTGWTGEDAAKQAALIRASAYIDSKYRKKFTSGRWMSLFPGTKTGGRGQALEWPRTDAQDYEGNKIPSDEIPAEVQQATYEAALRELSSPGSLSPDYVPSKLVKRQKVDVIEREFFEPGELGSAPSTPVVSVIDNLIAPVLIARYELPGVMVV
ncbi:DnaT-like ssDNA-binding protein [Pseudomonas luteola]|uniref:DnaT-like ssDNA-binding protein n=1 Tax=Pseudomonas luteola TaxID=47886 RepID=UPI003A87B2F7